MRQNSDYPAHGATHKVVITDFIDDDMKPERDALLGCAEVEAIDAKGEEDLDGRIEDADAIMVYHNVELSKRTIEKLRHCRLIVRCGVGYDNVDWRFAATRGIPVANVPDYGTEEVADSAIGMALSLARGIHRLNSTLREGSGPWSYSQVRPLQRLRGRTFGIVGLGRIGTAAALRAKVLGMDVLFYDPYRHDGADKMLGVRRTDSLEELLEASYILSLHCPLTSETRHLVDADAIARMPRGSYLINTARGGVVDIAAVPPAIAEGQLTGAGIDVLEDEPPAPDNPLVAAWRDPNHHCHHRLILNPHTAFYSEQGLVEMRVKGATACRAALLGQPLRNVINRLEEPVYVGA